MPISSGNLSALGDDLYEIEPQHAPGKRLDVARESQANNTEIHIYDRHGRANQRWKALPVGDGTYRFEPQNAPGKRLDIENVDGVPRALSRTLDQGNSQRWRLIPVDPSSIEKTVSQSTAPEPITQEFNLYPNPVDRELTVESSRSSYRFTLYDSRGRQLMDGYYPRWCQPTSGRSTTGRHLPGSPAVRRSGAGY